MCVERIKPAGIALDDVAARGKHHATMTQAAPHLAPSAHRGTPGWPAAQPAALPPWESWPSAGLAGRRHGPERHRRRPRGARPGPPCPRRRLPCVPCPWIRPVTRQTARARAPRPWGKLGGLGPSGAVHTPLLITCSWDVEEVRSNAWSWCRLASRRCPVCPAVLRPRCGPSLPRSKALKLVITRYRVPARRVCLRSGAVIVRGLLVASAARQHSTTLPGNVAKAHVAQRGAGAGLRGAQPREPHSPGL